MVLLIGLPVVLLAIIACGLLLDPTSHKKQKLNSISFTGVGVYYIVTGNYYGSTTYFHSQAAPLPPTIPYVMHQSPMVYNQVFY